MDETKVHMVTEMEETLTTALIIRIGEEATVTQKETFIITEVEVKIIRSEGNEDNGMEMTPLIMTEIIGIGIPMAKAILTGVEDGTVIEARDTVTREEGENGTLINNIMTWVIHNSPITLIQIIMTTPIGHQYQYPIPYEQYSYSQQQQYQPQRPPAQSCQATNI